MASEMLRLGAIGQIALPAPDIERSVEFYRDRLGMTLIARFPSGLAFMECDGVRLMLSGEGSTDSPARGALYFKVDDIQDAFERLKSQGIEFNGEPHVIYSTDDYELWMAFFKDPSGNQLAVMDERGVLEPP